MGSRPSGSKVASYHRSFSRPCRRARGTAADGCRLRSVEVAPHSKRSSPDTGASRAIFTSCYAERRASATTFAPTQVGIDEWLVPLLYTVLGYDDLALGQAPPPLGERVFKLTHRACGEMVSACADHARFQPRQGRSTIRSTKGADRRHTG